MSSRWYVFLYRWRELYWRRHRRDTPNATPPPGMVSVTVPGKPPVFVPINEDELEVVGRIIEIAKGQK